MSSGPSVGTVAAGRPRRTCCRTGAQQPDAHRCLPRQSFDGMAVTARIGGGFGLAPPGAVDVLDHPVPGLVGVDGLSPSGGSPAGVNAEVVVGHSPALPVPARVTPIRRSDAIARSSL